MSTTLALAFVVATQTFNLPEGLLSAVCYVESGHDPKAFAANDGGSSSFGPCQVKLSTARLMGFKGSSETLKSPVISIHYGAAYLHRQLHTYSGDIYRAISGYNGGSHKLNSRGLTRNGRYVDRVYRAWGAHR